MEEANRLHMPERSLVRRALSSLRNHPLTRRTVATVFRGLQSLGVSVVPVHFYFCIPDLRRLSPEHWSDNRRSFSFDLQCSEQLRRLSSWSRYREEWAEFSEPSDEYYSFHLNNGFFETVDAEVAYSIVRERRSKHVIEIGGGNSTRLLASALRRNSQEGYPGQLFTIDPYPDPVLHSGFPGLTQLIELPVQKVHLEFFDSLAAGDILFIDSSHVAAIGSDVVYEMLQILPRLKPGVLVHLHDIFLPAEYPEKFVRQNLCFWNEQYMLEAFLSFNDAFRVIWASSAMQTLHPHALREAFPCWEGSYERMPRSCALFAPTRDGRNVWPSSVWLQREA